MTLYACRITLPACEHADSLPRSGSKMYRTLKGRSFAVRQKRLREYRHRLAIRLTFTVSQFTLLASTKKGNKPDFHGAAGGEEARELYDHFFAKIRELYEPGKVKNGIFQAMMEGRAHVTRSCALLTYSESDSEYTKFWPCRSRLHQSR